MKKLIFLLVLLLVFPVVTYAQDINGNLTLGYISELRGFCTQLNVCFTVDQLSLYGGIEVLMDSSGYDFIPRFSPYRSTYLIGSKFDITPNIFLQFEHSCTHPVYSNELQFYDKFAGGNRTDLKVGIQW